MGVTTGLFEAGIVVSIVAALRSVVPMYSENGRLNRLHCASLTQGRNASSGGRADDSRTSKSEAGSMTNQ
jgi:hypothetical protein